MKTNVKICTEIFLKWRMRDITVTVYVESRVVGGDGRGGFKG